MVQIGWDVDNLKILTASDGSGKICESCCGTPPEQGPYTNCTYCPGEAEPNYIYVQFAGIANQGCVPYYIFPQSIDYGDLAAQVNGAHILTQINDCVWGKSWDLGDDGVAGARYSAADCTGSVLATINTHIFAMNFTRISSTQIRLQATSSSLVLYRATIDCDSGDGTWCVDCAEMGQAHANQTTGEVTNGGTAEWSIYHTYT